MRGFQRELRHWGERKERGLRALQQIFATEAAFLFGEPCLRRGERLRCFGRTNIGLVKSILKWSTADNTKVFLSELSCYARI